MSSQNSLDEKHSDLRLEAATDATVMQPPARMFTDAEEKRLYRRLDLRVMPILALLYLLSFLDRGNVGNARLYGLEADLRMDPKSGAYGAALSVYFATYCLCEVPANLMLKKLSASVWLSSIAVAWGLVMLCMGFVQSFAGLIVCRLMLGITEAGLFPGVILYITMMYPRHMTQYRIALFFAAATTAGAFSGLLAFAIGKMQGLGGYSAWRYIFILEGAATILAGVLAYFAIVDSPDTCKILSPDEKEWIKWRKYSDSGAAGEAEHVNLAFIAAACTNWQVWLSTAYYISIVVPLYSIGLTLPTIIKSFATFTTPQIQLLTIPIYLVACAWVVICAILSDKMKKRFIFVLINQILALAGFVINITPAPYGLKYLGLMIGAMGAYGGLPSVVAWLGGNLMGQTKRGVGVAIQIGIGNLGALISSNVYRTVDAPRYIIGHGAIIGTIGMGLFASPLYAYLLSKENKKRDAEQVYQDSLPEEKRTRYTVDEIRTMGDLAPSFRYTI